MANSSRHLFFYLLIYLLLYFLRIKSEIVENVPRTPTESNISVHIGAILNPDSPEGATAEISMSLAISDFYAIHSNFRTRLSVETRSAKDFVGTAAAVVDLLKNVEVHAIMGPQVSDAAPFVIKLGCNAHVPIISIFETSPILSPTQNPYFIRAAQYNSDQVKAIAAILHEFEWYEAVLVYEDTDFGDGIVSYLVDAFQENDVRLAHTSPIPIYAEDFQISEALNMLMRKQTRVFIVHMTSSLGSRLFALANKAGMMSEGYVWIITSGISNSLKSMDYEIIDSMEGVLGIRSYVPMSKDLENFKMRWKKHFHSMKPNSLVTGPYTYSLWAYDTIWALASAVERIGITDSSFLKLNYTKTSTDFDSLGTSRSGPRLLKEILNTKFKGLSGEFNFVNGQLESSAYQIFNVMGRSGEKVVGYWTPDKGISQKLGSTSSNKLKKIIWPGDSTTKPKGWAIPKLKIGIPVQEGFTQFVKSYKDYRTNKTICQGFSCDLFLATLQKLDMNVSYEFIPFEDKKGKMAGSYDELIEQIEKQEFDAVVGDTTIVAKRTKYVDFTLPYLESGFTMLVPARHDKHRNMWIFLQPWSWDLWLSAIAACIFITLVIRIMECHTENIEFQGLSRRQLGMILLFPFYALVLPQREMVVRDCSKFVLLVWLCLAFILTQSYTASLSSMLTLDQLQPTFDEVKELQRKGHCVGYQHGSFVKEFLLDHLKFNDSKLKPYSTVKQYYKALSKGSDCENGGVAAIFDEIPYIKVFLARYGSQFLMAGPTYRTEGFGFAFPRGSPLVSYFSRAILEVREQGDIMDQLEEMYLGEKVNSPYLAPSFSTESSSLRAYSFGGLFITAGLATLLALLVSESYIWRKPITLANKYIKRCLSSRSSRTELVAQPTTDERDGRGHSLEVESPKNPDRNSSL